MAQPFTVDLSEVQPVPVEAPKKDKAFTVDLSEIQPVDTSAPKSQPFQIHLSEAQAVTPQEMSRHTKATYNREHPPQFTLSQGTPWETMTAGIWNTQAGRAIRTASDVWHGFWNLTKNPLGMTDEAWTKGKKSIDEFSDKVGPHIVNAIVNSDPGASTLNAAPAAPITKRKELDPAYQVASGAVSGTAQFGAEMLSGQQLALMAGTLGESTLVRGAAKLGIKGAIPAARTVAKLAQLKFTSDMIEGSATGAENTYKAVTSGDWRAAGQSAVEALISGLMARGIAQHEMAQLKVQGDLNKTAQANYGKSFEQLNPYEQGLAIHETVTNSPEYQEVLKDAEAKSQQDEMHVKRQHQEKLEHYYSTAIDQSRNPHAAQRVIEGVDRAAEQTHSYLQAEYRKAVEKQNQERAQLEESQAREKLFQETATQREKIAAERQKRESQQPPSTTPQKEVPSVPNQDNTGVVYPTTRYGQEAKIYVSAGVGGYHVSLEEEGKKSVLADDGEFSNEGESYLAPDKDTADTLARITALKQEAGNRVLQNDAEAQAEYDQYSRVGQQLITDELTAQEARNILGIKGQERLPDSHDLAAKGELDGIYAEGKRKYFQEFEQNLRDSGKSEEEIRSALANHELLALHDVHQNLHHVTRSGDYILDRNGTKWELGNDGLLHGPNGRSVPLMRDGTYSNQAMQMAAFGRIGYGTEGREARAERVEREVAAQKVIDGVDKSLLLSGPEISQDKAANVERFQRRQTPAKSGVLAPPPEGQQGSEPSLDPTLANMMFAIRDATWSANPDAVMGLLEKEAKATGIPVERLIRQKLGMEDTPIGRITALRPGDEIRSGGRLWIVNGDENGILHLDSGGARIDLNWGNIQKHVLGKLVKTGDEITFLAPTHEDFKEMVAGVRNLTEARDRKGGGGGDDRGGGGTGGGGGQAEAVRIVNEQQGQEPPEPKNQEEAEVEVVNAEARATKVESAAAQASYEAINPKSDASEAERDKKVAQAEELRKTAQQADVQVAKAKANTVGPDRFPGVAPITSKGVRGKEGLVGESGFIIHSDQKIPFHYELVDVDDVIPSHVWNGNHLDQNPKYEPKSVQVRGTYETADEERMMERGSLSKYNIEEFCDLTSGPEKGPTTIEPGGRCLGGNSRLNIMLRYLENLKTLNPEIREVYLNVFKDRMQKFAEKTSIRSFPADDKVRIVVRVVDEPIDTVKRAVELANLFNGRSSVAINEAIAALTHGKFLVDAEFQAKANGGTPVLTEIAKRLEGASSALEALHSSVDNQKFFADVVRDHFGVPTEEKGNWFKLTENGEVLKREGEEKFLNALIATHIRDVNLLGKLGDTQPRQQLAKAIGSISLLPAFPDRDITGVINRAVEAVGDTMKYATAGSSPMERWKKAYRVKGLLDALDEEAPLEEPNRIVEAVYRALWDSGSTRLNRALKDLVGGQVADMSRLFDVELPGGKVLKTPADYFNHAFAEEIKDMRKAAKHWDKPFPEITQEEFEAALHGREFARADGREVPAAAVEPTATVPAEASQTVEKQAEVAKTESPKFGLTPPPSSEPEPMLTGGDVKKFLVSNRGIQKQAKSLGVVPELLANDAIRTASLLSKSVYDLDKAEELTPEQALEWILQNRFMQLENTDMKAGEGGARGEWVQRQERWAKGILRLHQSADITTFIHEFGHAVMPLLDKETLHAFNRMEGPGPLWDGSEAGLDNPEVWRALNEKFTHGLELTLRNREHVGFDEGQKKALARVRDVFQKLYADVKKDPLSAFSLNKESKEFFDDTFGFDPALDAKAERERKLKAEEAKSKRIAPLSREPSVVEKIADEVKPERIKGKLHEVTGGIVDREAGDRVDPNQPLVALAFKDKDDAEAGWLAFDHQIEQGKIKGAELVDRGDGTYDIRFNGKPPETKFFQSPIEKDTDSAVLERLKRELAEIPLDRKPKREYWEAKIQNLESKIRAKSGVEALDQKPLKEKVDKALQEVENGKPADRVREGTDGVSRDQEPKRTGGISKPPVMGVSGHAAAGESRGEGRGSLSAVNSVSMEPLPPRSEAVGTYAGERPDLKVWQEKLAAEGGSPDSPLPTWPLERSTAAMLDLPMQSPSAQIALSALMQGDGALVANTMGGGKTRVLMAIIKEWGKHDDAEHKPLVLYLTKNRTLLGDARKTASKYFGFDMDFEQPNMDSKTGVFAVSYQKALRSPIYQNVKWDLVVADECGEARNWFREPKNKDGSTQGQMLMAITENAKKVVYASATPFHAPMEYGYLAEKLGLCKKGQFSDWVKKNFHTRMIDGKIVAELDPSKQAKIRQQLIARGQMVVQAISYEGLTGHFGVVPVTPEMKLGLDRINVGFDRAREHYRREGNTVMANEIGKYQATFTKTFLERQKLPQAIELTKQAVAKGWQVTIATETTGQDLFHRDRTGKTTEYQELDDKMGGKLKQVLPELPDVFNVLQAEFGDQIGDYSGAGNTLAERDRDKDAFTKGEKPILYTTFAAGGIGINGLQDADFPDLKDKEGLPVKGGTRPRLMIVVSPPYSGVSLEQTLGRPYRADSKSDAIIVFLAVDAPPDVDLMRDKVGPRMRALRAAVHGEKDSLSSAMHDYTSEEKVRARQDALAYAEGDEVKINTRDYKIRTHTRDVGIQNWNEINFPHADTAKNKGMSNRKGMVRDWTTLFQAKYGGMEPPPSPEDAEARKEINRIADLAAQNPDIPREAISLGANMASEISGEAPQGIDKTAAARHVMEGTLAEHGFFYDPETGQVSVPHWLAKKMMGEDVTKIDERKASYGPVTLGMGFNQRAIVAGRKIGAEAQVRDALDMTRDYRQAAKGYKGPLSQKMLDFFNDNKLNFHKADIVRQVIDVVEGNGKSDDPRILDAASKLSALMVEIRQKMGDKGVHTSNPRITYKDIKDDPRHIPHFTDWDMKLTDPETGVTKTLKQITDDKTLDESAKMRYFEKKRQEMGKGVDSVQEWIKALEADRQRRIRGPKNGTVTEARHLNHPFYHKDIWALDRYLNEVSSAMALEDTYGHDMGKFHDVLAKVPSRKLRQDLEANVQYMFEHQDWSTRVGKLVRSGQNFEAVSKMMLSPIAVPFHQIWGAAGLNQRYMPLAKAYGHFFRHPHEFMREKYYAGVVGMRQNPWELEGPKSSLASKYFDVSGFNGLYRWVRAMTADMAKVYMEESALESIKKGGTREIEARRILKDRMLIGDQAIDQALASGKWTEEDLLKAQRSFADTVAWDENPNQMPRLSRQSMAEGLSETEKDLHAAAHGLYTLQSFTIKSYSAHREWLYDEIFVHKNLRVIAPFLLVYPAAGLALKMLKSGAFGGLHRAGEKLTGKKHTHDRLDDVLTELEDAKTHPWVGGLRLYVDGLATQMGMESTKRWSEIALLLEMGGKKHKKEAFGKMKYAALDELEQKIGGIYSDLWNALAGQVYAGYKYGTTQHAKPKRRAAEAVEGKIVEQLAPGTKLIPWIDKIAHPPKR